MSLFNKFKSTVKQTLENKSPLVDYMKKMNTVHLNYNYETKITGNSILYSVIDNITFDTGKLNEDIEKLKYHDSIGIVSFNIKLENFIPLLKDKTNFYFNPFSNIVCYRNDAHLRHYKNDDVECWLDSSLEPPIKALTFDTFGNISTWLLGTKENNIKRLSDTPNESSITLIGEYFGLITKGDQQMFIYGIKNL